MKNFVILMTALMMASACIPTGLNKVTVELNNSGKGTDTGTVNNNGGGPTNNVTTFTVRLTDFSSSGFCFTKTDNTNYCWGSNAVANSATAIGNLIYKTSTTVLSGKAIKKVVSSTYTSCAIASDDLVYCWGGYEYTYGNALLGDNNGYTLSVPVAVSTSGVLNGKTVKDISMDNNSVCVIASDDKAYCWGGNSFGQLGNNSNTDSYVPVAVNTTGALNGKTIKNLKVYNGRVCAIASDDLMYCWGSNSYGELGTSDAIDKTVPTAVDTSGVLNGKTILEMHMLNNGTCVVASDHLGYCFGYNYYGLGTGSTTSASPAAIVTTGALAGRTIKTMSASNRGACIIADDDLSYCWGYGRQTGDGSGADASSPVKTYNATGPLSGKTIKDIKYGSAHTCAIASDDNVYCWGDGPLGNNSSSYSAYPVAVDKTGALSGRTAKKLIAVNRTCIIADNDLVYCWGSVPVAIDTTGVLSGKTVTSMVAGGNSTLYMIASDNNLYTDGFGTDGQRGDGKMTSTVAPTGLYTSTSSNETITDIRSIVSQKNGSVCISRVSGGYFCGLAAGRLSETGFSLGSAFEKNTFNISGMGIGTACFIADDESIYCQGVNGWGQLGNGTTTASFTPKKVTSTGVLNGLAIKEVQDGYGFNCALAGDNKVYCWGTGTIGQLGNGASVNSSVPVAVSMSGALSGLTIEQLTVGNGGACVIASDKNAYCWGSNLNLGSNSAVLSNVPVAVSKAGVLAGLTIKKIKMGYEGACAIASDDKMYCWGTGGSGQLGNAASVNSLVPVAVSTAGVLNSKTILDFSLLPNSWSATTCAIDSDGKAYCWGLGTSGQLGNSASVTSNIPVAVTTTGVLNGKTLKAIGRSATSVCAVDSNEEVYCWGNGGSGQLGQGSYLSSNLPVKTVF